MEREILLKFSKEFIILCSFIGSEPTEVLQYLVDNVSVNALIGNEATEIQKISTEFCARCCDEYWQP